VAGIATAPISAFHFNQISQYGLAANLMAVPIMGMLVMPSAVLAFILMPLGLEGGAFWMMGKGIGYILWVSQYFSSLDQAVTHIKSAPEIVLAGITIGGLILLLWQGKGRAVGLMVVVLTIFTWSNSSRPLVLIDDIGKVFGLQTGAGRVVNKPRGSGYAVKIWLENDGDAGTQTEAFAREGIISGKRNAEAGIGNGWQVYLYSGDDVEVAKSNCDAHTILILSKLDYTSETCIVIAPDYLRHSGAVSVNIKNGIPVFEHSRDAARNRPWGY
jgi:competence protein ComEC